MIGSEDSFVLSELLKFLFNKELKLEVLSFEIFFGLGLGIGSFVYLRLNSFGGSNEVSLLVIKF